MPAFANNDGGVVLEGMIRAIQAAKRYLSDVDGAIGDGDHGINMNKGFTQCAAELARSPGDLSHGLRVLSAVLMGNIGGSMGPLYGMFFRAMAQACAGATWIDAALFGAMLRAADRAVRETGGARVGDKTMLDALTPAAQAFDDAVQGGKGFAEALDRMRAAAEQGRDSTKDMIARVGRTSRLGERSRGTIDAGAASCCLLLESMAESIKGILVRTVTE